MRKLRAALLMGILLTPSVLLAADPAATPKPDPLKTCVVSGDTLGSMGKPYVFVYEGQEIKLCCKTCKADFDKDPSKYVKIIQAAE